MPAYTYVYILANTFKHVYIGVTSNLEHRIWQHKNHAFPAATPIATTSTALSTSSASA